jgi:hypothetical protein
MKDLEIMTKKWLRLMWEAASGGRTRHLALWRHRREMTSGMGSCCFFEARIVPVQGAFNKSLIFFRATRSPAGTRPPTLVGSKVLSKFMIFNVNSLIRHLKNLDKKTRSWDIAARNKEY